MTVGELRAAIAELPDDAPVVVAIDEEGNAYYDAGYVGLENAIRETPRQWDVKHPDDVTDECTPVLLVSP